MVQDKGRARVHRALLIERQEQQLYECVTILPEEAGGRDGEREELAQEDSDHSKESGLGPR